MRVLFAESGSIAKSQHTEYANLLLKASMPVQGPHIIIVFRSGCWSGIVWGKRYLKLIGMLSVLLGCLIVGCNGEKE